MFLLRAGKKYDITVARSGKQFIKKLHLKNKRRRMCVLAWTPDQSEGSYLFALTDGSGPSSNSDRFPELWINRWTALCAAAAVQLPGSVDWVLHLVFTRHGSITAGHCYSFTKEAATSLTTGQTNR